MAAKKRGGSSKKKSSSTAAAASSTSEQATDELLVPKSSSSSSAATAAAKTETKQQKQQQQKKKQIALDSDDDGSAVVELKVNEKFAKAFQEQKRKEELNRLERQRKLYGDADDDDDESESESETEDEDGEQLTSALDADIRKTLQLIRKKDPAIYDQSITFFKKDESDSESDGDSSDDDGSARKAKRKAKTKDAPLYYKDLVRQQVIAGDVDSEDDADKAPSVLTYDEEQAKIKQDFLASLRAASASDDDDDDSDSNKKKTKKKTATQDDSDDEELDGGLFTIRKKTAEETQAEADEYASFTASKHGRALAKAEVDPDAFLEHYLSSEGWKDKRAAIPHYDDIVNNNDNDDDDSADELERAEAFEHSYNFRFEEEGSGLIQTHARRIDDSLRREDDSRKRKRAERKERKALERRKKEEELRRLKNLKQAEIESKLAKVAKLMGKDTPEAAALKLTAQDLDGAFDPDEYDRRMQEVFDDAYYNEADGDDADALVKPVWDEDEDKELFAGLPVDSDDDAAEAANDEDDDMSGHVNIVEAADADDDEEDNEEPSDGEEEDGEDEDEILTEAKAKHMSAEELARAKQKYLDELYALDYEDLIGDIKCRFKYRSVPTNDFGLTVDEIMAADDKELKALVSLKRLAPYAETEYRVDRKRVKQFKKSLAEAQRERDAKRLAKAEAKAAADAKDAAMEAAAAPAGGKKRKRAKKSKATAAASDSAATPEAPAASAETTAAPATTSASESKKKQRRSKKKGEAASSALKATGLSSSRLESYKLTKATKSKDKKAKK